MTPEYPARSVRQVAGHALRGERAGEEQDQVLADRHAESGRREEEQQRGIRVPLPRARRACAPLGPLSAFLVADKPQEHSRARYVMTPRPHPKETLPMLDAVTKGFRAAKHKLTGKRS